MIGSQPVNWKVIFCFSVFWSHLKNIHRQHIGDWGLIWVSTLSFLNYFSYWTNNYGTSRTALCAFFHSKVIIIWTFQSSIAIQVNQNNWVGTCQESRVHVKYYKIQEYAWDDVWIWIKQGVCTKYQDTVVRWSIPSAYPCQWNGVMVIHSHDGGSSCNLKRSANFRTQFLTVQEILLLQHTYFVLHFFHLR